MTKQETSVSQETRDPLEEHTPQQENENLPIGKLLRQVREKKAMTIHDISRATNISSSNLTSIELGNYNELPADTFIRGQIIIYAHFLGLDGTEAARLFFEERAQHLTGRERKQFNQQGKGLSTKKLAEPTHISSATWAITLLLLIATFLALFSWYTGWNPFAYFLEQEPAPISTATAVVPPAQLELGPYAEARIPAGDTPEEVVEAPVAEALPAPEQAPEDEADNKTAEQDTTL
ncbi:MAG: helix-turn-helix domain-containing protein [Candidatus Electrothrix sp. GW3-4]|uniref:helix-turn-helix domain-containing protein n=1 Tax=Candidatus Electrothrix sp. GW3-4 TaxID=3126740 RepID=UPI0030D5FBC8